MKKLQTLVSILFVLLALISLSSCETEDPGPVQEVEEQYSIVDFDRLELGDAFNVTVEQSSFFEVSVRGDRRNVDDLSVRKEGSTLIIKFDENRNRIHDTYVTIKMPVLYAANFSGASHSKVSGFDNLANLQLIVSGASVCQLDVDAARIYAIVSGASYLTLTGQGERMHAEVTGASFLKGYTFPVHEATIHASGGSVANVSVSEALRATASGASSIEYRGDPVVNVEVSGGSNVRKD
jgi:hypothetical protein